MLEVVVEPAGLVVFELECGVVCFEDGAAAEDVCAVLESSVPLGVPGTESVLVGLSGVALPLEDWAAGAGPELPAPPNTTAAAPATSSTAAVTAPTSVLRRGPPGSAPSSPPSGSSNPPSNPAGATAVLSSSGSRNAVCRVGRGPRSTGSATPGRNQSSGALVATGSAGSTSAAPGRGRLGRLLAYADSERGTTGTGFEGISQSWSMSACTLGGTNGSVVFRRFTG